MSFSRVDAGRELFEQVQKAECPRKRIRLANGYAIAMAEARLGALKREGERRPRSLNVAEKGA
jgi:hypothetical protein